MRILGIAMVHVERVLEGIERFEEGYRHPNLVLYEKSDLYSLLPDEDSEKQKWPQPYPYAEGREYT